MTILPAPENFDQIVRKYQDQVFRTALGFVHIKEDAEDLTQEVFLRAYRSWKHFRGDADISTWLYRITVNLALTYINIRNKKSLIQIGSDFLNNLFNQKNTENDPLQQLEQTETEQILTQAIDSLPAKQRTAFILARYDDLPQKEIARIMETSEGAVEQLLIRAKTNLQKKLEKTIGK